MIFYQQMMNKVSIFPEMPLLSYHTTYSSALASFAYDGWVNNTTASPLVFESRPILTPDGYLVLYDSVNNWLCINQSYIFNGSVMGSYLNYTNVNNSANSTIDRSKAINTTHAYAFRESYDFVGYFDTDNDDDGIADEDEAGFKITLNDQVVTVQTDPDIADTDGDGLLDGSDIVLAAGTTLADNWVAAGISYSVEGDNYHFYGEATYGTHPLLVDTDYDGLLDGYTLNTTWGSELNGSLNDINTDGEIGGLTNTNHSWGGDDYTLWHGEINWSTDPLNDDSDNDNIEDGAEVNGTAYLGGAWRSFSPTSPTANDTDGDGLDDNVEIAGYSGEHGTYYTDPTLWSTDGDNISDKVEIDGWSYYVICPAIKVRDWSIKTGFAFVALTIEQTAYGDPHQALHQGRQRCAPQRYRQVRTRRQPVG